MHPFLGQVTDQTQIAMQTYGEMIRMVGHSVLLGIILMVITVFTSMRNGSKSKSSGQPSVSDILFNSSNVLYLCVGMTSVMLLVNNNLARAFAIGAAIALVRFRIKMDSKNFAMCLFYGVIIGMACGVDQVGLAYLLTVLFSALQLTILFVSKVITTDLKKGQSLPADISSVDRATVADLSPANNSTR